MHDHDTISLKVAVPADIAASVKETKKKLEDRLEGRLLRFIDHAEAIQERFESQLKDSNTLIDGETMQGYAAVMNTLFAIYKSI
jgi:hypothetical protein